MDLIAQADIEGALQRVLRSEAFHRQAGLQRFLHFVVTETLAGRQTQIKEYSVGVSVYSRGSRFDPRTDAIVRVEARKLRGRLDRYYEQEGATDPVRLELAKGSYVPQFRRRRASTTPQAAEQTDATELKHRAWYLLHNGMGGPALEEAARCFKHVVRLCPNSASAYADLAIAHVMAMSGELADPAEALPVLRMAASEALRLDESSSQSLLAGFIRAVACGETPSAAMGFLRRATEADPLNPFVQLWCAFACSAAGEHEQALGHSSRAIQLQPLSAGYHAMKGTMQHFAGRHQMAESLLQRASDLKPENFLTRFWLSRVHSWLGWHESALAHARWVSQAEPCSMGDWNLGYVQARAGLTEDAERTLHDYRSPRNAAYATRAGAAAILGALGRREEARQALQEGVLRGEWALFFAHVDPAWSSLL